MFIFSLFDNLKVNFIVKNGTKLNLGVFLSIFYLKNGQLETWRAFEGRWCAFLHQAARLSTNFSGNTALLNQ